MDTAVKFAKAMGVIVATVTTVGILWNLKDIRRYIRMSSI